MLILSHSASSIYQYMLSVRHVKDFSPTRADLAVACNLSFAQVSHSLKRLIELDIIAIQHNGWKKPATYRLLIQDVRYIIRYHKGDHPERVIDVKTHEQALKYGY